MDDQHEEVEHIPWGELLAPTEDGRRRIVYLAAAAVGVMALTVVVTRTLSSPSGAAETSLGTVGLEAVTTFTVGPPPVVVESSPTDPALPVETAASTVPASTTTVEVPILYSEADLMAFPPDGAARAAASRAEWFVTDYFTSDLEPGGVGDILEALPDGVELPEMPHDLSVALSYVEWARAFSVEEIDTGRFLVGVVFRRLGAPPEGNFRRLPAEAVEVMVEVAESGGAAVIDIPSPVDLPDGPAVDPWPEATQDAPQPVIDGALLLSADWGSEPRVVSAFPVTGGWRMIVSAADRVGNRWPLVVWVDDDGMPLRP